MSYEKQTWANGDVITATGLNHMEDGIADGGGGGYFVHATVSDNEVTVEENVNDIVNAIKSAQNVAMVLEDDDHNIIYLALDCYLDAEYNSGTPIIDFKSIADIKSTSGTKFNVHQKLVSYDGENTWYYENRVYVINAN